MTQQSQQEVKTKRGVMTRVLVVVLVAAVAAAALGFLIRRSGAGAGEVERRAVFKVRRGRLDITIKQTGDVQTVDPVKIIPEIMGEATIIELAEEGTRVKKGDLLVKLDSTQLEENLARQEIEVENSTARLVQAQEGRKIQELTNRTSIADAKLALSNSRRASEKYGTVALDGEGLLDKTVYGTEALGEQVAAADVIEPSVDAPRSGEGYQAFRDAELEIVRAQTNVDKAARDLDGMDELYDKGFVTKNDCIEADLKFVETTRSLESARLKHALLREYTYPAKLAELEAGLAKAEAGLEQAELSAAAQMVQKEASITQAERIHKKNEEKLAETRDQLSKMTITAPEAGLVLYGEEGAHWYREEIKVGSKVHRGRVIITLPRVSGMKAVTRVLEKDVNKVKAEQKAVVTLAALADMTFSGKVTRVASVASEDRRSGDTKTFDVDVGLDAVHEQMKPGMSCEVEVTIETLENVLYVPVNAVFKREGEDVCYVVTPEGTEARSVQVGQDNDIYTEIKKGLEESEEVFLYSVVPTVEAKQEKKEGEAETPGDEAEGEAAEEAKPDAEAEAEGVSGEQVEPAPQGQGKPDSPEEAKAATGEEAEPGSGEKTEPASDQQGAVAKDEKAKPESQEEGESAGDDEAKPDSEKKAGSSSDKDAKGESDKAANGDSGENAKPASTGTPAGGSSG